MFLKVAKVVEGVEKSEYIMVLLHNLYKEYAEENFGLDKITTLKIKRQNYCGTKIKYFFRSGSTIENGRLVKSPPSFTLVPGVEKETLPLKKKNPCYLEAFEK